MSSVSQYTTPYLAQERQGQQYRPSSDKPRYYQSNNHQNGVRNRPNGVTLKEPYFSQIREGLKTIEGRINSGQFKNLRAGETITFINGQREVRCKVEAKRIYKSFREMLTKEGVDKCLPDARNLEAGVNIYDRLPGFPERARQSGVVALQIKVELDDQLSRKREINEQERLAERDGRPTQKRSRDEYERGHTSSGLPEVKRVRYDEERNRERNRSSENSDRKGSR
jgi:ASC-1-like (ASCH) protein